MQRAVRSLEGLSIGDAFGEQFFGSTESTSCRIERREVPAGPWQYTDDTVMALSVVDVLSEGGCIDRDRLADFFMARYLRDPVRGYGRGAHEILGGLAAGEHWRTASTHAFDGRGSMGNGGAMRTPPVGAYFADDFKRVVTEARQSAEVTHAHPEGQSGAIAVAIAAAYASSGGRRPADMFAAVLDHTPHGETRAMLERASSLPMESDIPTAVTALGNGTRVISQDTVPFALWCAARHLGDFEEALWTTVSGLGDRDTTCAIVGGIVASDPACHIPPQWLTERESLDQMSRRHLPARFAAGSDHG
jgi:ADP-ribosylglycohydrolase